MFIRQASETIRKTVPDFPLLEEPWELFEALKEEKFFQSVKLPKRTNGIVSPSETNTIVYASDSVEIQPYALFSGLVILEDGVKIGPYSLLRGPIFVGKNSIIGPHCEIIRSIVLENSIVAHKNTLGETIIGNNCNYAGLCTSCNYPVGRDYVKVRYNQKEHKYNGKFGATIENNCNLGCLTITMPGCHIKQGTDITGQCIVHGTGKVKPFSHFPAKVE